MLGHLPVRRASAAHQPLLTSGPQIGLVSSVSRRTVVAISAELTAKGRAILPQSLNVDRTMGEGSFGVVYQGTHRTPQGDQRVVLKRVKTSVEGAQQMGEMELLLNAYAAKVAKNHCADFLGYCEVAKEEATARLTPGLWLMWKFEGSRTLHYYLRRRDTLRALASDLEVAEEAVVATVMKQILEGLAAFHAAGLVHRDIKPLNIIFAENLKRFKMIDLGACADLRTGTNYCPDESILDPNYCPPEQYVLPTDSPHLAKSFLKLAISPMLWAQHKPDRFDMWSAGITMLQLAVPAMRQDRVLKRFNTDYGAKYDYDLDAWRAGSYIQAREFEVLDADGGTGWELVKALLRPRSIRTLNDNTVVFVNDNTLQRISAGDALRHKFLKQAREPGSIMNESLSSSSGSAGSRGGSKGRAAVSGSGGRSMAGAAAGAVSGSAGRSGKRPLRSGGKEVEQELEAAGNGRRNAGTFGAAVGLWRNLTNKLFDLEANIMVTASATEKQTTMVKNLQQKVVQGQVPKDVLQKEQRKLNTMEKDLTNLQDDFNTTANAVSNVLGFLGFGGKPKAPEPVKIKTEGIKANAPIKASRPNFFGSFGSMSSSDEGDAPLAKQYSAAPIPAAASKEGGSAGIWAAVQQRLSDLEMKLTNQAVATERQVFTVKQLRVRVKTGQVDESTLSRAEAILQRMERRVGELDKDLKQTRQEATGLLGMLASSVNQLRGGSQDVKIEESSPPPPPLPQSSVQRQTAASPTPVSSTARGALQSSGMGGFFGRMFGSSPAPAAVSQSPAARDVTPKEASPGPASEQPSGSRLQSPSGSQLQSTGAAIGEGANNLIASSLKFTGMAAKVAMGMAASMKADAEKVLKELEAEAEAKRVRKATEQAFMRMLGTRVPPMEPGTTMAEVEASFGEDTRFLAVDPSQRTLLVASFVDALAQSQIRSEELAKAKLRDLYSLVKLGSTWEEVAARYIDNPVFTAVTDPTVRRQLYEEVVGALQAAEDNRLAAGLAEQAFLDLLSEVQPPVAPETTWPRIKPLIWRDFRYLAVPELRRKELFDEMHVMVVELAKAAATVVEEKAVAEATSVTEILKDADGPTGISPQLLQELRNEQTRLRSEYDAMERKLREMESAMVAKERASALLAERAAPARPPARAQPTSPTAARPPASPTAARQPATSGPPTSPTAARPPASPTAARMTTPQAARRVTPALQRGAPAEQSKAPAAPTVAAAATNPVQQQPAQPPTPATDAQALQHVVEAASHADAGRDPGSAAAAATKAFVAGARSTLARIVTPSLTRITTPPLSRGSDGAAARRKEEQVADSLEAAGVHYRRLKDGTLVFTFDDGSIENGTSQGDSGSPTPAPMATSSASNSKGST